MTDDKSQKWQPLSAKSGNNGIAPIRDTLSPESRNQVYESIRTALADARTKAITAANAAMVSAYWEIGREIADAVGDRAEYGKGLLRYLSERLMDEFGKGFDESSLRKMRKFYLTFPIRDTVCPECACRQGKPFSIEIQTLSSDRGRT